jgi:DNA ligase-1
MELARLAITSRQLAATRSRTTKRELIATVLRDTGSDELETVVSYLSGTLPQRRTGIGWSALDSLPTPADQASLSVADVHASFERISAIGGPGSAALRNVAVHELFARATASEQDYLRGLVFDELRQGALDSLVQDGLAEAHGLPAAAIRRAAMLLGSTAAAATVIARDGPAGLDAVRLQVGLPVRPMLAASAPDPDVALARKSLPVLVDVKLDGIRVQVHRDGSSVGVWTRSLEDITDRVPEVVEAVLDLPVERVVLDAEVLALGAEGRPAPFQAIAARTASRVDVAAGRIRTPLSLFCFDLLHADGLDRASGRGHRLGAGRRGLRGRRGPGLRGHSRQGSAGAVCGRTSRRCLGQGQAPAHVRPRGDGGGVGPRTPTRTAVQPAPGRA